MAKRQIGKNDFAAIWSPDDGYYFLLPNKPDDEDVPEPMLALMAAFLRLCDERDFYNECLEWFHRMKRERS